MAKEHKAQKEYPGNEIEPVIFLGLQAFISALCAKRSTLTLLIFLRTIPRFHHRRDIPVLAGRGFRCTSPEHGRP